MITIDRKTGKVIAHTEIKPENMHQAQVRICLEHIRLNPHLLDPVDEELGGK
jgi:hypothetical protein